MGTLRFVMSWERYSDYQRADGTLVHVAHGFPRRYLIGFDQDWIRAEWASQYPRYTPWSYRDAQLHRDQAEFREWVVDLFTEDPMAVDELLEFCYTCHRPTDAEEGGQHVDNGSNFACETCVSERHYYCYHCEDVFSDTVTVLSDNEVCRDCLESYYSSCDQCDGYYNDQDRDEHQHNSDCCTSPQLEFSLRNAADDQWLSAESRTTVTLPAGVISQTGISAIHEYLWSEAQLWDAARELKTLDARWQTREGNFTKRLSRAVYKKHGQKISPDVLSRVGSIAMDHARSIDFGIEITRDLNRSAYEFGHSESCWWGSYASSRCSLKSNGGFGLRSFSNSQGVSGRAWVLPLKVATSHPELGGGPNLIPTFDTRNAAAFVVFNCYGDLQGYNAARIVGHMTGMTYRKISFDCDPMYVNDNKGYLVASEEIAEKFTNGYLNLYTDDHSSLFRSESTVRPNVQEPAHV